MGSGYAKSVAWRAPRGAYLGGFYGMSSEQTLKLLQFVWVKRLPPGQWLQRHSVACEGAAGVLVCVCGALALRPSPLLPCPWCAVVPAVVTVVGATTPWYTTGFTSNVAYFDDTKAALA